MLDKDYEHAQICNKKQTMISDALVKHASSIQGQRPDAKTILLVDEIGGVQKPTAQTLNLLGTRTSRVKRQKAKESDDKRTIEDDQLDFLGFIRPMKRFHGNLDGLDTAPGQVFYRCAYGDCQKYFLTEQHRKTHMAYHLSRSDFVCSVPSCGKSFNYRHNLSMHMRVHNDHRPFECPQNCGKSFRTKGNMMDHLRRHYAIKPYKCSMCPASFYRNNILSEHIQRCALTNKDNCSDPAPIVDAGTVEQSGAEPVFKITPVDTSGLPNPTSVAAPIASKDDDQELSKIQATPSQTPNVAPEVSTQVVQELEPVEKEAVAVQASNTQQSRETTNSAAEGAVNTSQQVAGSPVQQTQTINDRKLPLLEQITPASSNTFQQKHAQPCPVHQTQDHQRHHHQQQENSNLGVISLAPPFSTKPEGDHWMPTRPMVSQFQQQLAHPTAQTPINHLNAHMTDFTRPIIPTAQIQPTNMLFPMAPAPIAQPMGNFQSLMSPSTRIGGHLSSSGMNPFMVNAMAELQLPFQMLMSQLQQFQMILQRIQTLGYQAQMTNLIGQASALMNCNVPVAQPQVKLTQQQFVARNPNAKLIMPEKFDEPVKDATKYKQAQLDAMDSCDFDMELENYFRPFEISEAPRSKQI